MAAPAPIVLVGAPAPIVLVGEGGDEIPLPPPTLHGMVEYLRAKKEDVVARVATTRNEKRAARRARNAAVRLRDTAIAQRDAAFRELSVACRLEDAFRERIACVSCFLVGAAAVLATIISDRSGTFEISVSMEASKNS